MIRETATHTEDLPHVYESASNPGERCKHCGHGRRAELHRVTARELATAQGDINTMLQRELGS